MRYTKIPGLADENEEVAYTAAHQSKTHPYLNSQPQATHPRVPPTVAGRLVAGECRNVRNGYTLSLIQSAWKEATEATSSDSTRRCASSLPPSLSINNAPCSRQPATINLAQTALFAPPPSSPPTPSPWRPHLRKEMPTRGITNTKWTHTFSAHDRSGSREQRYNKLATCPRFREKNITRTTEAADNVGKTRVKARKMRMEKVLKHLTNNTFRTETMDRLRN